MSDGGTNSVLGIRITPITRRRLANFRANGRGFWSMWIFLVFFLFTLSAEFVANDKPLVVQFQGGYFFPVLFSYPETMFGGDFETEAEYREFDVQELITEKGGWMVWPLIPFSYNTVNLDLKVPSPAPPSAIN